MDVMATGFITLEVAFLIGKSKTTAELDENQSSREEMEKATKQAVKEAAKQVARDVQPKTNEVLTPDQVWELIKKVMKGQVECSTYPSLESHSKKSDFVVVGIPENVSIKTLRK